MIWCIKTCIIAYVKIKKDEDILSSMSNLQRNWCLKMDFEIKVLSRTFQIYVARDIGILYKAKSI